MLKLLELSTRLINRPTIVFAMKQIILRRVFLALVVCLPLSSKAQVTLAWTPSAAGNITNYTLFWGTASGVYKSQIAVGTQTSASVSGLTPGTVYYFAAQATDANGLTSAYSGEVCYTNSSPPPPPPTIGGPGSPVGTGTALGLGGGSTSGTTSGASTLSNNNASSNANTNGSNGAISEYSVPGVPPLLRLAYSNNAPVLGIFGTVGSTLLVQRSTNLLDRNAWTTVTNLLITNAAIGAAADAATPPTLSLALVPALQYYQVDEANFSPSEFYRVVMPYDYSILAGGVLSAAANPSRLILVRMPGISGDDVCYVTPQSCFLFYDAPNMAFAVEPSGPTIRQIATTQSGWRGQNWTSASEFSYSNGVSAILATVVETEPASSDPVASSSSTGIIIDF